MVVAPSLSYHLQLYSPSRQ